MYRMFNRSFEIGKEDTNVYYMLDIRDKGKLVTWALPRGTCNYKVGDEVRIGDPIGKTRVSGDKYMKGLVTDVDLTEFKIRITFRVVHVDYKD